MQILANAKYYLNYLYFNRGDTKIREYFSSNEYNNAIKELSEEGYHKIYLEFQDPVKIYSNQYHLNTEETLFISQVRNKFKSKMKYPQNYNYYLTLIQFIENYIGFYRMPDIEFEKEFKINFLKCELELYKKELTKTLPIIKEAVILRKFVNILLKKLIIKYIDNIDINDYIPHPTVLCNYQKSLNSHYIFRKEIKDDDKKEKNKINDDSNIEDKIKDEIKLADNYYVKKNSKITYKRENDISKI